ncbi:hypothetical protein [Allokutzneria albata]|uniref:Peptidase inhibitor family I36 n=1 Tax=Allokutzneria albata TaxID=211114 RepID=A0A1G9RVE9_ALLAB|nr:hypothetical protein [Allokutzneria albata]SDM27216.1 hypothetical protein SAMN04489726_0714 [Allokutzneria albata]
MLKVSARSAGLGLLPAALAYTLLGVAPSASAAPGDWECSATAYACLYEGAEGTGAKLEITACGQHADLPSGWWDRVDSARVMKAGRIILFSYYPNGGGKKEVVLEAGHGQYMNAYAANKADSIQCYTS